MKKAKTILWQSLIGLIPLFYLLSIWKTLPESLPIHYNLNMTADRFGTKFEMAGILLFMLLVSIGVSLLAINLNKFDPKQRYANQNSLIVKISWTITVFITLVSIVIVYQAEHNTPTTPGGFSPKYIFALASLLFVVLGNFTNNIKPNYLFGFRTPWTLEDEDNWRRTHHLSSKILFFGGLVIFVLVMLLPTSYASYIYIGGIIPLIIIPVLYSYYIFRQKQKNG